MSVPRNKIIRVFPQRTSQTPDDELAFVGDPGLFRPEGSVVHVSCVFTWDKREALRLAEAWGKFYPKVIVGGPAFEDPGNDFEPGVYLKRGVTITSRGCPSRCPWCFVPKREGDLRLLPIKPGNIVQDNNLLACPRGHVEGVFQMLLGEKAIRFAGGLEAGRLEPWHVDWFKGLRINELWFAADRSSGTAWAYLERAAEMVADFPQGKKRCYVLVGFNRESLRNAEVRLERVWDLGLLPFAQFYRGDGEQEKTKEWRKFLRRWCRPAATKAIHK